ncbi:hypothetical protein GCM10023237_06580 [Streptomyces coeruleoprunus]
MCETPLHTDDVRPRTDLSGTDIALVPGTRSRPRPLGSVELAHAPLRLCVRRSSLPYGPADGEPLSHTVKERC